ncbi:hypothetical protein [Phytohabitans suffuscus]
MIYNGGFYSSGYEGNNQNGIQYIVLPAGTPFQVGGNGIRHNDIVADFSVSLYHTDLPINELPGRGLWAQDLFHAKAAENCVVNQRWVFPNPNPPTGTYQINADYIAGNSGVHVRETIAYLIFVPPTQPPPDDPGDPGGGCLLPPCP